MLLEEISHFMTPTDTGALYWRGDLIIRMSQRGRRTRAQ